MRLVQIVRLRNSRPSPITLVLEPWAGEYQIGPRETLDIMEDGNTSTQPIEIHLEPSAVVVFGRDGGVLRVFRDGRELL
jgi:hypothetical protein